MLKEHILRYGLSLLLIVMAIQDFSYNTNISGAICIALATYIMFPYINIAHEFLASKLQNLKNSKENNLIEL